jgi:hypothetical protein
MPRMKYITISDIWVPENFNTTSQARLKRSIISWLKYIQMTATSAAIEFE